MILMSHNEIIRYDCIMKSNINIVLKIVKGYRLTLKVYKFVDDLFVIAEIDLCESK